MKLRLSLSVAIAIVAAACGGNAEVGDTQPRPAVPLTTTLAPVTPTTEAGTTTLATGGSGSGGIGLGAVSPQLLAVRSAMEQTSFDPPARIEGLIEVAGTDPDLGRLDVSIPISSAFDSVTGDGFMSMDFSDMTDLVSSEDVPPELAGAFDGIELRQVGDTAYMKFGLLNMMFGVETEWLSMPVEAGEGFAQDFSTGVNPYDATGYMEWLAGSDGHASVVGTEELRGVATTHYRVVFDLAALAELDPEAFAELQAAAPVAAVELPMDLWIDAADRIHRFRFEIDGSDFAKLSPGESFDYMRIQFDFSDYGGRVDVDPPPAVDVTDIADLEDMFGEMFAGFEDMEF